MSYQLLNLACGSKVSKTGNWTNVDFQSPVDEVIEMNILKGLRFPEATFDVVYSAQFIEHLTLEEGEKVLKGIARVMKPGGVLRLVTPDLEELSRSYLHFLDQLKADPNDDAANRYDWVRMELFDQIVRDHSGGDTPAFLAGCDEATKRYVIERLGYTATTFFTSPESQRRDLSFLKLLRNLNKIPRKMRQLASHFLASEVTKIGVFRRSGEVHRYMHDVYSLSRLLRRAGFDPVTCVDAHTSAIKDWQQYELDVVGGVVDAPLSLYVEAKR